LNLWDYGGAHQTASAHTDEAKQITGTVEWREAGLSSLGFARAVIYS
jgi:hypothetical protein